MNIISLGAGVQSTTVALMVKHGDLPPVDGAIFADTQDEPAAVYRHLDWLESVLPFPIYRVTSGHLSGRLFEGDEAARFPCHKATGPVQRQCTRNYKVKPIRRKTRQLLGASPRGKVRGKATALIGISLDEAMRMKPSGVAFIENRWPLIEKRMTRRDCIKWLEERQYRIPHKSRCVYCPFQNDRDWRELRNGPREDYEKAIEVDRRLRAPENIVRFRGELFLHPSLKPLDEVDLSTLEDHGQLNMFNNECEGLCGV